MPNFPSLPMLAAAGVLLLPGIACAQSATFVSIPGIGSGDIVVLGMSPDGQALVGKVQTSQAQTHAFRWTQAGGIQLLWVGYALDASSNGVIVGGDGAWGSGGQGVRWTSATGAQLIGGREASAVSADGSVVVGGTGTGPQGGNRAFRWTAATGSILLPLLPGGVGSYASAVSADGSIVAGSGSSSSTWAYEAFRWTSASGTVGLGGLPGASHIDSSATAISSSGNVIAGSARGPVVLGEPFRWSSSGGLIPFGGSLVNGFAQPQGITADGSAIVGTYYNTSFRAFIWTAAGGIQDMQDDLFTRFGLSLPGWTLNVASGISDDGTRICGYGTDPTGKRRGFLIILEPPTPPTCYANCDNSSQFPILNILDFVCFLTKFTAGDPYANCNNSTTPPVLNIADFTCFLNKYTAGCP